MRKDQQLRRGMYHTFHNTIHALLFFFQQQPYPHPLPTYQTIHLSIIKVVVSWLVTWLWKLHFKVLYSTFCDTHIKLLLFRSVN